MSAALWTPAYIALGSNLDQPEIQIARAFDELASLGSTRLVLRSAAYLSAPMGPQDQPHFVNAVGGVLTQLSALELLAELQAIEQRMGRASPALHWGPRLIDLDLLLYGETRSDTATLQLPHSGLAERNFVMIPLAEIAPELPIPGHGSAQVVAQRLGYASLTKLP